MEAWNASDRPSIRSNGHALPQNRFFLGPAGIRPSRRREPAVKVASDLRRCDKPVVSKRNEVMVGL